jgi:hypothetical protein
MKNRLPWIAVILIVGVGFLFYSRKGNKVSAPQEVPRLVTANPSAGNVGFYAPPLMPAPPNSEVRPLNPESQKKLGILKEILNTKNDNDPRMDTILKVLTEDDKAALRQYYETLKAEDRNGRGTVVFLLGRNIHGPEDFKFLDRVLTEAPCLSLADCTVEAGHGRGDRHDDGHGEMGSDVTLAYPQLATLHALGALLEAKPAPSAEYQAMVRVLIEKASHSPISSVAKKAQGLLDSGGHAL